MNDRPDTLINENTLQVEFLYPNEARSYVEKLVESSNRTSISAVERVEILGEIGVTYLHLRDFELAESYLKDSLLNFDSEKMDVSISVKQNIRLANTLQWKKQFRQANDLYEMVVAACRTDINCSFLLDFALQHYGKCLFDQSMYAKAEMKFEEALAIRMKKGDPNLIQSTKVAIEATTKRLSSE